MKEMYDHPSRVQDTFTDANITEYLLHARWAELIELKKVIAQIAKLKGSPLVVLDIGVGVARLLKRLVEIEEIWAMIHEYDGIDVAEECIKVSEEVIAELSISDKVAVKLLDAVQIGSLEKSYDLVISTWFTAGNFFPFHYDVSRFQHGMDLSTNEKFTRIFRQAYQLLNPEGELVIGSVYIDNDRTRQIQEESYRKLGWQVITDSRDSFTATSDGWWSQRFTKEKILDYLSFIPKECFTFVPLDTYDYAMMVRIKK